MDTPIGPRSPSLRRGAATRAGAHISEQLQNSPISSVSGDDELSFGEPPGSRDRQKPNVKRSYAGKGRFTSKNVPPSLTSHSVTASPAFSPSHNLNGNGRGKKRSLSDAEFTPPLSSPASTARRASKDSPQSAVTGREAISTPRNKKRSSALQKSANSRTTEDLPPPTPLIGQLSTSSISISSNEAGSNKLGALAWILVDKRGHLVKDDFSHTQSMWWPAFVSLTSINCSSRSADNLFCRKKAVLPSYSG